ncbi:hypothetical protein MP228_003130 [Amoeboaphelidium protococcarum]|nr:hypothetical protein MP228_003130 [Amoeboaphelidium protococcarum]
MLYLSILLICVPSAIIAQNNQFVLSDNTYDPSVIAQSETLDAYAHRIGKFCGHGLQSRQLQSWCNTTVTKIRELKLEESLNYNTWFAAYSQKRRTLLLNDNVCYEEHLSNRLSDLYFGQPHKYVSECSKLTIKLEVDINSKIDPKEWMARYLGTLLERVQQSQIDVREIALNIRLNVLSDDLVQDLESVRRTYKEYRHQINLQVLDNSLAQMVKLEHSFSDRILLSIPCMALNINLVKQFSQALDQPSLVVVLADQLQDYRQAIASLIGVGYNFADTMILPSKFHHTDLKFTQALVKVAQDNSLVSILKFLHVDPRNFNLAALQLLVNQKIFFQGPLYIASHFDFLKVSSLTYTRIPHDRDLTIKVLARSVAEIQPFFNDILPVIGARNVVFNSAWISCNDLYRLKVEGVSSHVNLVLFECVENKYRSGEKVLYEKKY